MMKNAAVIALSATSAVVLWGCNSQEDKATADLIKAMETAKTEYEAGKTAAKAEQCTAATDKYEKAVEEINKKYADLDVTKTYNKDDDKVKKAQTDMDTAKEACESASSGLETSMGQLHHQEMGRGKRSHGRKAHSHHHVIDDEPLVHHATHASHAHGNKGHARVIDDDVE